MKSGSGRANPFINRQPLKTGGRGPFMERVRKALGREAGAAVPPVEGQPAPDESLVRQMGAGEGGRVERWMERAKANTMVVQRVADDTGEVTAAIDACFAKHTIGKSILNARELEGRYGLAEHLTGRGIAVVRWGTPDCREAAFACEASVTDCRAGLADAGSLMVWSDETFGRSSTLVVPVHVMLLPASRILPDMIDGLEMVMRECRPNAGGALPSNVVIINGPSKTADIEMNLITGVHGPKHVYVILIDGA